MTAKRTSLAPRTVYYDLRGFGGERMEVLSERFAATRGDIVAAARRLQLRVMGGRHTHAGSLLIATDSRGLPRWRVSPNLAIVEDIAPSAAEGIVATLAPALPLTPRARRAPAKRNSITRGRTPKAPVVIEGMTDMFKLTRAPYHTEERVAQSGRSYTVKVYEHEAYALPYMRVSDESNRLVRWVVNLSTGQSVSRDGVLRMRDPEAWARLRPKLAKLRGEARAQAMGEALWEALSAEEREAMVAAVDLTSYALGRSLTEARKALGEDLATSGNPLAYADVDWSERIDKLYAEWVFGAPHGSPAWRSQTWHDRMRYEALRRGEEVGDTNPLTMPIGRYFKGAWADAEWWRTLKYFVSDAEPRLGRELLTAVTARVGGPVHPTEAQSFPVDVAKRRAVLALADERIARMSRADREPHIHSILYGRGESWGRGALYHLHSAWLELAERERRGS